MYVQSGSREHLDQNTLACAHQNPQETRIPAWNGLHWETLPLSGTSSAPPTLTIFRPPVSDGRSRTPIVQPRWRAPSAEPLAILPHAAPAAADVPTSHLPAIMDANVRPAMDGPSAAVPAIQDGNVAPAIDGSAHNVDGNTTKPPPLTAGEIRDKVLAARGIVATSRKAKGLSFCYYPYQRRGYNRRQSCMRTVCLTVILLISP